MTGPTGSVLQLRRPEDIESSFIRSTYRPDVTGMPGVA
jgi:hypothetical protein